jgi:hypothetical protein
MLIDKILTAFKISFAETVLEIAAANRDAIKSERYGWKGKTERSTGEIASSPRNIVDTGYLRDSQDLDGDEMDFKIFWTADYAADVHEGVGKFPARRWTQEAIRGDRTAPIEWQNSEAFLNVPKFFKERFDAHIAN